MEDQGKRLLLTVGIVAVMYLVWSQFFVPKQQPAAPAPQQVAAPAAPAGAVPAPASVPAAAGTPGAPAATAEAAPPPIACDPSKEENPAKWETPDYVATFSRCGGALSSLVLKGAQYRVEQGEKSHQMDIVRTSDSPSYFPLQVQVSLPPAGSSNADDKRLPVIPDRAEWALLSANDAAVTFRWTAPDGALQVDKTFKRMDQSRFAIGLDFEVKNISSKPGDKRVAEASVVLFGVQDPNVAERSMFHYAEPTWGTACYIDGELKTDAAKELHAETRARTGAVKWTGIDHQYFLLAAAPLEKDATTLTCTRSAVSGTAVLRTELAYSTPSTLEPNQSLRQSLVVYAGPKLTDQLEGVTKIVGQDPKFGAAVDLGWFAVLARPMMFLLKTFHSWVGNWGLAIIMLTILVKLATLYWTTKSMRSMKAMSKLKPEMDRVKEKYPDDKTRQNEEMIKLYRTHKISPFGGCLPMLLQMPIWLALYRTLASAADLYRAPFGWMQDLTAPDPYYIMPVALTAIMFVQARITPAAVDSQQQKMMQWIMPFMMGVFSLIFASGLAVYMMTNTVLGMAHQFYMNRVDAAKPEPVKAVVETPAPSSSPKGKPPTKGRKNMAKA